MSSPPIPSNFSIKMPEGKSLKYKELNVIDVKTRFTKYLIYKKKDCFENLQRDYSLLSPWQVPELKNLHAFSIIILNSSYLDGSSRVLPIMATFK